MTEQDWLKSEDQAAMLWFLMGRVGMGLNGPENGPSDRKLRLFAVACCRQVWDRLTDDAPCQNCSGGPGREAYTGRAQGEPCPECGNTRRVNRSRRAVEVAERFADGLVTVAEMQAARVSGFTDGSATMAGVYALLHTDSLFTADGVASALRWRQPEAVASTQAALLRCLVGNPWRPVTLGEYDHPSDPIGTRYPPPWLTHADGLVVRIAQSIYDRRAFDEMPMLADALEDSGCTDAVILAHCREPRHARGCWVLDLILGKE